MIVHAGHLGDFAAGATVDLKFTTTDDIGRPFVFAGTPTLAVYHTNDTTQSTSGVTLTVDFDSLVGLNHVRITTVSDGTFYAAGREFYIVVTQGTVDSIDQTGYAIGAFSISNRPLQGLAAGVITAAAIADNAIDAGAIATDAITAAKIADGAIDAATFAAGAITAAAIAADAIGASELAADAVTEIADGILKRDMSAVTGESSRSPLNALRFLRNKWSISGSTLTVTKEDDSTSAWTAALTTSGSADPVTGSDPS